MSSYTISDENGCKVVRGAVPITDIAPLMQSWAGRDQDGDDEWVADAKVSTAIGACLVCGPLSATTAWRQVLGIQ